MSKGYSPEQARIAAEGAIHGDRLNYEDGYLTAIKMNRSNNIPDSEVDPWFKTVILI